MVCSTIYLLCTPKLILVIGVDQLVGIKPWKGHSD